MHCRLSDHFMREKAGRRTAVSLEKFNRLSIDTQRKYGRMRG